MNYSYPITLNKTNVMKHGIVGAAIISRIAQMHAYKRIEDGIVWYDVRYNGLVEDLFVAESLGEILRVLRGMLDVESDIYCPALVVSIGNKFWSTHVLFDKNEQLNLCEPGTYDDDEYIAIGLRLKTKLSE